METPRFRRFFFPGTERVEVITDWPDETFATREFLEAAEPRWLQRKGRMLSFALSNSSAAYRIASRERYRNTYLLKRVG